MNRLFAIVLVLSMLAISTNVPAQQSVDFDEYVVHYNALLSNLIPPEMAQAYGIQRSSNQAVLNITVLRKEENAIATPVHADVSASAVNLSGQRRTIKMREISDLSGAVYYIGDLRVYNMESFDFTVNVEIEGLEEPAIVQFSQQFYTE